MRGFTNRSLAAILVLSAIVSDGPARAADMFAGKKLTVTVPASSGGTYHVYCQIVSLHLGRHIPGKPTVVVQNRPGAGGALASAFMFNVAAKDGTEIAMMAPGSITAPLYNKINYDARSFEWLGSIVARSSAIWVWHTTGIRMLEDLKTKTVKMGSTGFGAGGSAMPRFINKVLGTRMEIVYGYRSGGDINLGIERGEVEGRWNFRSGFLSVRPDWLGQNKIIAVIATGPRDEHHKNIPHLKDLLKAGSIERKVYDLLALDYDVGQAFYLPPGTPKAAVSILKTAFWNMIKDPEFKRDVDQRQLEFEPLTAEQVVKLINEGLEGATPDVLNMFREIFVDDRKKKT